MASLCVPSVFRVCITKKKFSFKSSVRIAFAIAEFLHALCTSRLDGQGVLRALGHGRRLRHRADRYLAPGPCPRARDARAPVRPSVCPSIRLSPRLNFCLSACLSVCLLIGPSVCSVCLSVCSLFRERTSVLVCARTYVCVSVCAPCGGLCVCLCAHMHVCSRMYICALAGKSLTHCCPVVLQKYSVSFLSDDFAGGTSKANGRQAQEDGDSNWYSCESYVLIWEYTRSGTYFNCCPSRVLCNRRSKRRGRRRRCG